MRKNLISFLSVLIVISVTATSTFAGDVFFDSVNFSLGSLIASGRLGGLGTQDVTIHLQASGDAVVMCVDSHGQQVQGSHSPRVSASGSQLLLAQNYVHGFSHFRVETGTPTSVSPSQAGCPHGHWTTKVTFVKWTDALLNVIEAGTHNDILHQSFKCLTTQTSVSCRPKQ